MPGAFHFHLPGSVLCDPGLMKPYYTMLIAGLRDRGAQVQCHVHDRVTTLDTVLHHPGLHILDHGPMRHPRVLNTGIAYIYPFWNLDPWGIRAFSSIAAKPFRPSRPNQAQAFADRLRARLVVPRKSRYPQMDAVTSLPQGCIAVFLQSEQHRIVGETCHLTAREMVTAVLACAGVRPVVIKPHPRDRDSALQGWLADLAACPGGPVLTDANIHDILAAAAVMVTINSAVGIEAYLHHVPVVLCGLSDFHHAAVTVTSPGQMAAAIDRAQKTEWPHDAFVHWYFAQNCLNAGKPTLVSDFLQKIATLGHDLAVDGPRIPDQQGGNLRPGL